RGAGCGLEAWWSADGLPYCKRAESWGGGANPFRGGGGPLATRKSRYKDPLVQAYFAAAADAGFPKTDDYNGAQQEGFGAWQCTIRDGRRASAARAYLYPALTRRNLAVETGALATRVAFEGARAVGIEYLHHGELKTARAEREVLLAGGVINSSQLLMLSGIGAPDELKRHDINVRVALPGVGKNLQDHMSA